MIKELRFIARNPDDEDAFKHALEGSNYHSFIWEMANWLRSQTKYGCGTFRQDMMFGPNDFLEADKQQPKEFTEEQKGIILEAREKALNDVKEWFYGALSESNISLD